MIVIIIRINRSIPAIVCYRSSPDLHAHTRIQQTKQDPHGGRCPILFTHDTSPRFVAGAAGHRIEISRLSPAKSPRSFTSTTYHAVLNKTKKNKHYVLGLTADKRRPQK
ncbi:hypothetical protein SUGI_0915600 [Cryptomeria japonica]|nr:hypothetical protein SUGI_0915600 [Cryptomeria japonica]